MRRTRYDLHMLALPRGARRLANVHKLLRMAAAYEARRGRDVRGFIDLATAELEAEAREPDAPVDLGGLDAVRLMTIHAAKGLEFRVVVVADLGPQGQPQPARPPRRAATASACGWSGSTARAPTALDFDAIEAERRAADEAEERRVMHVAMTRAEERLILSGAARLGDNWPAAGPRAPRRSAGSRPALVPGRRRARPRRADARPRARAHRAQQPGERRAAPRGAGARSRRASSSRSRFNGGAPAAAPAPAPGARRARRAGPARRPPR